MGRCPVIIVNLFPPIFISLTSIIVLSRSILFPVFSQSALRDADTLSLSIDMRPIKHCSWRAPREYGTLGFVFRLCVIGRCCGYAEASTGTTFNSGFRACVLGS